MSYTLIPQKTTNSSMFPNTLISQQKRPTHKVYMEKVVPIRYSKDNIIVCNRISVTDKIGTMSIDIANDVHFKENIDEPIAGKMYGIYSVRGRKWYRAMVKFSDENKAVMHLLDKDGLIDFRRGMIVREIENQHIINIDVGQIKIFIYAIAQFEPNHFFDEIFRQILLNQEVTAVFSLVEAKDDLVHRSYAGDFVYQVNGKLLSFREVLMNEEISIPKRVTGDFNQMIFAKRAEILAPQNIFTQSMISEVPGLMPYNVVDFINNRFEIYDTILGEGSFGLVFRGRDVFNDIQIAVKVLKHGLVNSHVSKEYALEAIMLKKMSHTNIIELIESFEIPNHGTCFAFPCMKQDLHDEIYERPDAMSTERAHQVLGMILSAVAHMHERKIVHRDLKPSNVLVDQNGVIKVCDFGLAAQLYPGNVLKKTAGTRVYQAPEVFLHYGYDEKVDIWAVGCILYEMVSRVRLMPSVPEQNMLQTIFEIFGKPHFHDWPPGVVWRKRISQYPGKLATLLHDIDEKSKLIIYKMLVLNPKHRPAAGYILL